MAATRWVVVSTDLKRGRYWTGKKDQPWSDFLGMARVYHSKKDTDPVRLIEGNCEAVKLAHANRRVT